MAAALPILLAGAGLATLNRKFVEPVRSKVPVFACRHQRPEQA